MNSRKWIFATISISILCLWLVIDTVNGYMLHHGIHVIGSISVGDVVRIVFVPILLLSIRLKRRDLFLVAIPYLLIVLAIGQYYWLNNDFVNNMNLVAKLSLPILLFLFIKNNPYLRKNPHVLQKIILVNAVVLLTNIMISYFGLGFANYTSVQSVGGTGFFYAGNEVAALLLVIFALLLFRYRFGFKKGLIISLFFFIGGIGLASKTALFGTLIIFFIYAYLYKGVNRYLIGGFVVASALFIYYFFSSYILLAVNRWKFFIHNYGALTYLTGGLKRWTAIGNYFSELSTNPFLILVGYGWQGVAEANLIDLAQAYGVLGISVYLVWVYWGGRMYKKMHQKRDKVFAVLMLFLIISVATLSGHVMQSAMVAPFVAILANLNFLEAEPDEQDTYFNQYVPVKG